MRQNFDAWIVELDETVIQGDYGYEPGEFTVYPEHWRPMFRKGLTPRQAFHRALKAHAEARREEDEARAANWQRIQAEDAKYSAPKASHPGGEPREDAQRRATQKLQGSHDA